MEADWLQKIILGEKWKTLAKKREMFLMRLVRSKSFTDMTLQERIISVASHVSRYEQSYGFIPDKMARMLMELNQKLNRALSASGAS